MSIPTDPDLSGEEIMRQFVPSSPFVVHLGMRLSDVKSGSATLLLPFAPSLATVGDIVHGGAIATLIDTTAMVAAWAGADVPPNRRGTTVGLAVSYLAAANNEDLQATARVLRRGRSLVYLDVEVEGASSKTLVAKGLVTYKLG